MSPTRSRRKKRRLASTVGLATSALLAAGLSAVSLTAAGTAPAHAADGPVVVTDEFDGSTLDPRFTVINPDPVGAPSVSGGKLNIVGQPGDTYQEINTAKNVVMLDIPAGDFTAETMLTATVTKQFQGAGLIAWRDIDNYVRSGLTFVGNLPAANAPTGIAIENDVETGGAFTATAFVPQPAGTTGATLRMERVGNTITTSTKAPGATAFVTAATIPVTFATTQVGLYALGAQDGTTVAAAFENLRVTHQESTPTTPPVLTPSTATLSIDGDAKGVDINDDMFGVFYEDINYAADGGLYAELVRNRSFEFNNQDNSAFTGLTAWQAVDGATLTTPNDDQRLNANNRTYLRMVTTAAGQGVRNTSYNSGFAIKPGAGYDGYLWARSTTPQTLTVGVQTTTAVTDTKTLAVPGTNTWTRIPFTLTGTTTTDAGRLVVTAAQAGTVLLDMVSLMPADRWVGASGRTSVLRKDLAEEIAAMDPGFVRFPGGCVTNVGTFRSYAESGYTDRRRTYQWKETVGPVEERPTNYNFWGYNQSYGLGYLEYFQFAEDLGAEALPVVSVGANGCGSNVPELTDRTSALFQRWVDDTVDIIEFANGDASTEWGAKRIAMGHPEPFGLEYIGLGNEENTTTFEANFPAFRDAVQAAYPDIKIVSNSGPDSSGARFDTLWKYNRAQQVDLVDEHYYRSPAWFKANNRRYDDYPRGAGEPKVFLGEYASRFNGNNNDATNLNFANGLSEASYLTALQRNADVVQLASYAPLLANESALQWNPDAIFFDNDQVWARPSWQVQKMFGQDPGTETVPSTLAATANAAAPVTGGAFLSSWNTAVEYDNVKVTSNTDGSTLFSDDFADATKWSPQAGTWAAANGVYRQSATNQTDARSLITGAYSKGWTNYTLELDARKTAGAEGFLVGFGAQASDDYYWYNLGGFNNTRSLLERSTPGGGKTEVASPAVGGGTQRVVTGQTYKVKIVVSGTDIEIFLDGVKQFSYDASVLSESLYQVVTRDAESGEITAKVVNNSATPATTRILTTDVALAPTAQVTTLEGDPNATNTKADPLRIAPETSMVSGVSNDFTYTFPKYSVTFVKMKATRLLPPVVTPPVVTPPTTQPTPNVPATPAPVATVSAPSRAKAGSRPIVSLAVSSAPAGAVASVTVTRKVVKTVNGKKKRKKKTVLITQVPIVGGVATLQLPRLRTGKHTVTVSYGRSSDSTKITVKPRKMR